MSEPRITVDGIQIEVGDYAWISEPRHTHVRRKKLNRTDLGVWWETSRKQTVYADRANAYRAAIESATKRLRVAQRDATRERRNIATLKARLAGATP